MIPAAICRSTHSPLSLDMKEVAANDANYAKWAHQTILDAPILRNSRHSRLLLSCRGTMASELIDISLPVSSASVVWPSAPKPQVTRRLSMDRGDAVNDSDL